MNSRSLLSIATLMALAGHAMGSIQGSSGRGRALPLADRGRYPYAEAVRSREINTLQSQVISAKARLKKHRREIAATSRRRNSRTWTRATSSPW